jgi:uncharacterized protein
MERWCGKWALVTGASSGIGKAIAAQLAANGTHLVLVGRRRDRLEAFAAEARAKGKIQTEVFPADLACAEAPAQIFEYTRSKRLAIDLLINNAGFGVYGSLHGTDVARQLEMVQVNCAAVLHMTHLFLEPMIERQRGDILITASVAAFQAVPYLATYAATKAFDLLLAQGLAEEVKKYGVNVCALCPGSTTDTEFKEVSGSPDRTFKRTEPAAKVARAGLEALAAGKSHVISGLANRLLMDGERLVPRRFAVRLAGKMYEPKAQE